tara:strand:+ start:549 stop:809 length:261 start_codon:yes stop_codon:yes gene_type:complete
MMEWTPQSAEQKLTQSANLPFDREQLMNEQDIEMFMKAFDDFMNHADVEMQNYVRREAVRKYNQTSLEQKAAEMEVTVDYYMSEFM